MSINEFAMVEELAFLVKDNLPSKHLVLSVEEALVNFLQDDSSLDGFLELEPMNPYNRLLVHRLAEIFGFAHESVGEGEDRHLVLERCPETSIPSILVSDILWQYDEPQSHATSYQLLRRKDAPTVLMTKVESFQQTIEEREAAYLAARQRIFAVDVEEMREPTTQRPRNVSVAARRMIAHALGQRIGPRNQDDMVKDYKEYAGKNDGNILERDKTSSSSCLEPSQEVSVPSGLDKMVPEKATGSGQRKGASSVVQRKEPQCLVEKTSASAGLCRKGIREDADNKDYAKEEHLGAAKRIFAHALGIHPVKNGFPSKSTPKQNNRK